MNNLRSQVLQTFKSLHKTRLKVFEGDEITLKAGRIMINEEFRKNKHVTDEGSISALIQLAKDVETEVRTRVIQAKEVRPGVYEARITEDTVKLDNIEFDEHAILPKGKAKCGNENKK